ncbi:hypothetical protein [Nitrosococcus wardiae]|uniref:Uncharacterized protein n=1 Tax=Nitrosococcus wardiae TaxID=1814290 RepID=A0A4P7C142_9GAMM|nr:hypothetical protein [Nitrosococcus wardiae]QBQ55290.1 hypothetical protein E3U44_12790 [Nitrosococcus wardiae]
MSAENPLLPRGEELRKALRWLWEQGEITGKTIEQASRQYNLSPLEEDFLIRKFLQKKEPQD